jgi:hypothetical protein
METVQYEQIKRILARPEYSHVHKLFNSGSKWVAITSARQNRIILRGGMPWKEFSEIIQKFEL